MLLRTVKFVIFTIYILVSNKAISAEVEKVYKLEKLVFEKQRTLPYSYKRYGDFEEQYSTINLNNDILFEFNNESLYDSFEEYGLSLKALPHDNSHRLMRYFPVIHINKFFNIIHQLQKTKNILISKTNFLKFLIHLEKNGVAYQIPEGLKLTYNRQDEEKLAEQLRDPEMALELAFANNYWFPERWILNAFNFADEKDYDALIKRINKKFNKKMPGQKSVWRDYMLFVNHARGLYRDNRRFIQYIKKIDYFSHFKFEQMVIPKDHFDVSHKYKLPNHKQASRIRELALDAISKKQPDGVMLLEQAANLGDDIALEELCGIYSFGEPITSDFILWFKKAAEFGYLWAYNHIGQLYLNQSNYSEALNWLTLGAQLGCNLCYATIGRMYLDGNGLTKNLLKAYDCFLKGELMSGKDVNRYIQRMNWDHDAQYFDISFLQTDSWSPSNDLLIK